MNLVFKNYLFVLAFVINTNSIYASGKSAKSDKYKDKNKQQTLPYGLQKKMERGEPLPPGWQKKLNIGDKLSNDLFTRGKMISPIDSNGNLVIDIEDVPIKINNKTREIIDILVKDN